MGRYRYVLILSIAAIGLYLGGRLGSWVRGLKTDNDRLHQELKGKTEEYKQLTENVAKLRIEYADQVILRKKLEEKFNNETKELKGRIKILSNATFLIREKARESKGSDLTYQGDRVRYVLNEVRFNEGPPVGYVLIFDDGRVISKLYNHQIKVDTAVSRDETSGRYSILSRADFVLKSPSLNTNGEKVWTNQPYPLKIVGGSATIDPTEPSKTSRRFQWWAPTFNGGFSLSSQIKASLGISLMGYGVSVRDMDWKFLQIGADYSTLNDNYGVHFIPVLYRPLPGFFKNTYIGPGLGYDQNGYSPNITLSVGL